VRPLSLSGIDCHEPVSPSFLPNLFCETKFTSQPLLDLPFSLSPPSQTLIPVKSKGCPFFLRTPDRGSLHTFLSSYVHLHFCKSSLSVSCFVAIIQRWSPCAEVYSSVFCLCHRFSSSFLFTSDPLHDAFIIQYLSDPRN